jgi:hypothetical protein
LGKDIKHSNFNAENEGSDWFSTEHKGFIMASFDDQRDVNNWWRETSINNISEENNTS